MLWDTAGQEEFDAITKAYYRGAQACVIVFSTTDRASFEAVKKWKKKVEDECGGGVNSIPMVLVQNKIDCYRCDSTALLPAMWQRYTDTSSTHHHSFWGTFFYIDL